jgi:uncharacterized protein (TIGR03067 family)
MLGPLVSPLQRSSRMLIPIIGIAVLFSPMATADECPRLEGPWRMVSLEIGGSEVPEPVFRGHGVVFEGDVAVFRIEEQGTHLRVYESRETFRVGWQNGIATIDLFGQDSEGNPTTRRGVYQRTRDSLRLCIAQPGQPRPTGFVSDKRNNWWIEVYKRGPHPDSDSPNRVDPCPMEHRASASTEAKLVPCPSFRYLAQCGRARKCGSYFGQCSFRRSRRP